MRRKTEFSLATAAVLDGDGAPGARASLQIPQFDPQLIPVIAGDTARPRARRALPESTPALD